MKKSERSARLSVDAGELLAALAAPDHKGFDCDLLVVGSGYGGAVAAARLAGSTEQDGRLTRIWMVERGAEYRPGDFPSRFAELPGFVRMSVSDAVRGRRRGGLLDLRIDGDVAVLLGNGLGGGSLINANVMLEPDADVFASGWPTSIDAASMHTPFQQAKDMLKPAPLPTGQTLRKLDLLGRLGTEPTERCPVAVTWHDDARSAANVEMHACTLCGDCLTGCNQGAKGSLDTNYLALAAARKVQMFCGIAVLRLEALASLDMNADGGWTVHWQHSDPAGASAPPIRARRVLLAAGALGSTEILLRSQGDKLPFSPLLGQGLSINGDAIAAGLGNAQPTGTVADPESDPADRTARHIGPTITGYKRVPPSGKRPGFVVQEFAVPAALRRVFGELVATLGLLRGTPMPGDDPALCSEAHIERMSLYGLMGQDDAKGLLELPAAGANQEGLLRVRWPDVMALPVFAAMNDWLAQASTPQPDPAGQSKLLTLLGQSAASSVLFGKLLWKAGGKLIASLGHPAPKPSVQARFVEAGLGLPETRLLGGADLLPLVDQLAGMAVTVHPLGGCRMSDGVATGVVNAAGQVWKPGSTVCYPGLAVLDGAIVPRALGINPALTITALAERAIPLLRAAWRLAEPAASTALPASRKRPPAPRRELPAADAVWHLNERLQGAMRWEGLTYWAVMELEFEDIPGFVRALQLPERVLQLRTGSLVLHGWTPGAASDEYFEPDLEDTDRKDEWPVLHTAQLSGSLRLFSPVLADQIGGVNPPRTSLDYRLAVQSCWSKPDRVPPPLRVGSRVFARKTLGLLPDERYDEQPSWLRQLSEFAVQIDGTPVGRWAVDLGQMAIMRQSLLSLTRHASLPDALLDALSGSAHVARQLFMPQLGPALLDALEPPQAAHLNDRWPGPLSELPFELPNCHGARLSRYRSHGRAQGLPVLLVHGMGASGSSYTHACLSTQADSLLQTLTKAGREVWVLDVRSSIANEAGRREAESVNWTVELIACQDIPPAIAHVLTTTGAAKLDLFGHCQGAVMSWMALLDDASLGKKINAAVFSQVGPWPRLSDINRLRAFLIGGMLRYLSSDELDCCPDFFWTQTDAEGLPLWQARDPRPRSLLMLDALLASALPYPDEGQEARRAKQMGSRHWIPLRHRADAIFGQLFELDNIGDETLKHLDALLGWVKLPMLAQAVHFARLRMITDSEGNNRWLSPVNLRNCLSFPVLILHGRRNRVFDWQGSERSLRQLKKLAYDEPWTAPPELPHREPGLVHYGKGSRAQLMVFENYGHFDCVIGEFAGRDVFPHVLNFLNTVPVPGQRQFRVPEVSVTTPFIGPTLGWLRWAKAADELRWLGLRVLLQPKSREALPAALALVPLDWHDGRPEPRLDEAVYARWPHDGDRSKPQQLDLWCQAPDQGPGSFALLLLDRLPVPNGPPTTLWKLAWRASAGSPDHGPDAAAALLRLDEPRNDALVKTMQEKLRNPGLVQDCQLQLGRDQLKAADQSELAAAVPALRFALASCQNPPTILDTEPAAASFELLRKAVRQADGPQFLLLAGDQIYLDADAGFFARPGGLPLPLQERGRRELYEATWRMSARRRCMTVLPCYPMLDDHEVADNWGGRRLDESNKVAADLAAYEAYQHGLAPATRLSGSGSYAYRINPAGVPIFMLDNRSKREPRRTPAEAADAQMVPAADMDALEAALLDLEAKHDDLPKFLLTAAPLLPPSGDWLRPGSAGMLADGWSGFPATTRRLLQFIAEHDIRRVVLLAGDSHLSSVGRFEFESRSRAANQLVAITSSGLYTPWPFANQRPEDLLPDGTEVNLGCTGKYRQELQSTCAGFAVVSLHPAPDQTPMLKVSLHSPNALSLSCSIELN